jgi:Na+/H+ antiporter NhaD/arsenite permease-like protein
MLSIIVSLGIFVTSLALIFSEKMNRTIVALAGAIVMILAGTAIGFFTQEQAMAAIDLNTLGLLMGMMILVALLEPTGFFEYLAVWVARLSQGSPTRLLILLGVVTTVISMFLDNVTTVVLIAPVTILISEVLGISSLPLLIAEALLSNTGGVATLVGDPPNVLIGSAAGFSFNDFLVHSLPIVLIVWLAALFLLRFLFRRELAIPPTANPEVLMEINPREALKDVRTARRVLLVLVGAVIGFLLGDVLHLQPSIVALAASAAAMVWVRPPIQETLKRVEWDILLFFGSLFVIVAGLEAAGIMHLLSLAIMSAINLPPVVLGVAILWVVALLSAVVDNIPITIALIPVIQELGSLGIDTNPLWWALAFGAGFGGNGTIIGSTANVIVVSLSERTRHPITPVSWNRYGLPVMLTACAVSTLLYILVSLTIGWGPN